MNKRRKEIEDKLIELAKKSPEQAVDYIFSATPELMNAISADISAAIGTYTNQTVPWIVAALENYAAALRQDMNEQGNDLVDAIRKAGKQDVVRMRVPRGAKSDADIPD